MASVGVARIVGGDMGRSKRGRGLAKVMHNLPPAYRIAL
jgi:hypothetical protein